MSVTKPSHILVAEDEDTDVFFLKHALNKAQVPHSLAVVADGKEAVDYLSGTAPYSDRSQHPLPALILLDLKMPRMSGFDVLGWLQRRPELKSIPAVVLTSSPNEADRRRAGELGAADYWVKPDSIQGLVEVVRQINARWLNGKS